jgi:hypothetical protein
MMHRILLSIFVSLAAGASPCVLSAQQSGSSEPDPHPLEIAALPDAPAAMPQTAAQATQSAGQTPDYEGKQTRRILGIIPNFRSVSVDQKLPPLSHREKFNLMMEDSFDYSSFIYVGILAGIAQTENSYPEFHHGAPAYARYYWHNFADTLDGNLMTEFLMPVATREDPRYYTLGRGGLIKRTGYSLSRLVITRTDREGNAFNFSEIVGNGAAAGISCFYYPSQERTWTKTGQRWVTQVGLDGFSNFIKEIWPDLNSKIFHNKY